jgi:ribosomal protein S18 acetylase RimI-like enzyme
MRTSTHGESSAVPIREFGMDDYDAVVDLWQAAGIRQNVGDDRASVERLSARDPGLLLVALADGRLAGSAFGAFDGRRGWVYHLAVDPRHQRKAIGSALLEAVEARLRDRGAPKVNLLIEGDNAGVQAFYERLGYGRKDLIFMEKPLG